MKLRPVNRIKLPTRSVPIALLVLCLVSFGLLVPWLGFYWDDWPTIWYLHLFGPSGLRDVFAIDRPSLGWLFMITTRLVGMSTLGWQLFGVLTRCLASLALWGTMRAIWPSKPNQATWIALLFAVYPGFQQQYISVTYSHDWLILAGFFFSFWLMVHAIRQPRWFWPLMLLSWLISAYVLFSDEYYFGLEFLRPVFLWIILKESTPTVQNFPEGNNIPLRRRIKRVLACWAPYLVIILAFLAWRIFLHPSPRGQIQVFDKLSAHPLSAPLRLLRTVLSDMFESSFLAWGQVFNFSDITRQGWLVTLAYAGFVLSVAAATAFFLAKSSTDTSSAEEETDKGSRGWSFQAVALGVFALFLGGWPFWVTYMPVRINLFPWDRFTLAMMLGASFLFTGLINLLGRTYLQKVLVLGTAIGLAAGMHFQIANSYRIDWNSQKSLFWQLFWRAPGIQPQTTLLTADLPLKYFSDNSLTAPLNWIYAPTNKSLQMPYMFYDVNVRLGLGLNGLEKGLPISQTYRTTSFSGSTSKAIVIYDPPYGCLKVLDPVLDQEFPLGQSSLADAMRISDLGNLIPQAAPGSGPPEKIFGPEPAHGWCYYFEKADLARQLGDWDQIVRLGDQAFENRNPYINPWELIPYIEGYAHTGKWSKAEKLTLEPVNPSNHIRKILCLTWARIEKSTPASPAQQSSLQHVRTRLSCGAW